MSSILRQVLSYTHVMGIALATSYLGAQTVHYGPEHTETNASRGDYALSYGAQDKDAPNWPYYYKQQQYAAPVATPTWTDADVTRAAQERVMGKVNRYSDVQYGDMVTQLLKSESTGEAASTTDSAAASNATPANATTPSRAAAGASTQNDLMAGVVADVQDRGVIVTSSGLRLRLRGVEIPSAMSNNPQRKQVAARSVAGLKQLLSGRQIYYVVEQPEKGLDGSTLAIIHVADGTEINRLALESGMGTFAPGDFPNEPDADNLATAEADARKAHRGLWSLE